MTKLMRNYALTTGQLKLISKWIREALSAVEIKTKPSEIEIYNSRSYQIEVTVIGYVKLPTKKKKLQYSLSFYLDQENSVVNLNYSGPQVFDTLKSRNSIVFDRAGRKGAVEKFNVALMQGAEQTLADFNALQEELKLVIQFDASIVTAIGTFLEKVKNNPTFAVK
jgi:hypothetical protein